ncbi:hypothetical protein [Marinoscillum furvescens]|uniref:Uncharacterized protein n=1 Tax=Marinoscillum furvescens DSM 4134 TaxID=1122208 RepID=A0A3D9KZ64_MARFU|nr:hypothetical protein [Marinoscillum furvescens]RED92994.1 hypothetical protein C7460_12718 [Marinoscillum furvescens DSM 4134]
MKRFNQLNVVLQWFVSLSFGILLLLLSFYWIQTVSESKIWMVLIFLMVPIIQFLITPLFTVLNLYTYYSPMVVSFGNNKRYIDLHNGTSFDYLMDMSHVKPGIAWRNKMLHNYLSALLKIIHQMEHEGLSNHTTIRGSSYFLSQRSGEKLGFKVSNASLLEKLNIALNYLDLIWMYSLTNGKLTFPNLRTISTVSTSGSELITRKQRIMDLVNRLESTASR